MVQVGQIVASKNYGGEWKVRKIHKPSSIFKGCVRYDLTNNGEILNGVRDKDIVLPNSIWYSTYARLNRF